MLRDNWKTTKNIPKRWTEIKRDVSQLHYVKYANQLSTRNSWKLNGKKLVKSKLPPRSGFVALRKLWPIKKGYKVFAFFKKT